MKLTNYFGKEKMDDQTFITTYIQKLEELTNEDIQWALGNQETDNEKVQSLLMEMVLSFYATDLVDFKDYEMYLKNTEYSNQSFQELQASLIDLFHQDRIHPGSLITNGIGKKQLLEILVEMKKRTSC